MIVCIYALFIKSKKNPEKLNVWSQLRWSTIFSENASNQLRLILNYCGMEISLETIIEFYSSQAPDPYVNRYRFRNQWWA